MSAAKRPPLPVIMLASDLLDGNVVFLAAQGWSSDGRDALVARDDAAADALERMGRASPHLIVDPYLVDVDVDAAGVPTPRHFRERLRLVGPSHLAVDGRRLPAGTGA
jgi:hypothetical protein